MIICPGQQKNVIFNYDSFDFRILRGSILAVAGIEHTLSGGLDYRDRINVSIGIDVIFSVLNPIVYHGKIFMLFNHIICIVLQWLQYSLYAN